MATDKPRVWNKRDPNVPKEAVYVGRPTKWGNPIKLSDVATRAECVRQYELMIRVSPQLMRQCRSELRGKHLVCWCAPLPCHADVLLEIANG